jgi:DNA (cytosine-5)-methyltransferase 3A
MNVLSLFDGMSCGQQALERAGISVDQYFASEIDKYAIKVTMANYPNTIQLGSVVNVNGYDLPKIDLLIGGSPCQSFSFAGKRKGMSTKDEVEILTLEHYLQLKNEGYEFEGQSYLFWEYMRLLNETKPKYFLLENVEMGEKWERILSKAIGVNGIHINSALVSAQSRKRIYWTNIGMKPAGLFGDLESIIQQPKDRGILLKDILETEVDEKYFLSESAISKCLKSTANKNMLTSENKDKSNCLISGYYKTPFDGTYIKEFTGLDLNAKSRSIRSGGSATATNKHNWDLIVHNMQKRSPNRPSIQKNKNAGGSGHLSKMDGKTYTLDTCNSNAIEIVAIRGRGEGNIPNIEPRNDGKSNSLTTVPKDNYVRKVIQLSDNNKSNGGSQPYQQDRIYDINGISPALDMLSSKKFISLDGLNENQLKKFDTNIDSDKANTLTLAQGRAGSSTEYMDSVSKIAKITSNIRRLLPIECERLQTVKDNYTNHVSDSQRYKMLGNGWTVEVIVHIFNYMK